MSGLVLAVLLVLGASLAQASCPPKEGIYLMHGGYCIPDYAVISGVALTADNPLYCVLVSSTGGGQWIGPGNTPVQCNGGPGPFTCSDHSNNITLYQTEASAFTGTQLYTCTIGAQSISVQIENNTVLSAIYIEPPSDVKSVPQNYTIHCITVSSNSISQFFLEKHSQVYYNNQPAPVTGYSQYAPALRLLSSSPVTYDSFSVVEWKAETVVIDQSEFENHGLTKNNGDHDWACSVDQENVPKDLQTYIRAPTTAITEITVTSRNATSISITWSVEGADDADGYVVYRNTSTGLTSGIDVGNVTQHTLTGLLPQQAYTISVRPYQDLLGPKSETVVRTDGAILHSLNWLLLSKRSELRVKYVVVCITEFAQPGEVQLVIDNETVSVNSLMRLVSSSSILLNNSTLLYNNSFTVSSDEMTNTDHVIECRANVSFGAYYMTIQLKAPNGPPTVNNAFIQSSSSITVSWSPPVGGANGYVILYSAEGASNMTQLVEGGDETSSLLTGLSEGQLYTISVFAYKDISSSLSNAAQIRLERPQPVSDVSIAAVSSSAVTVSWRSSDIFSAVTHYTITYTDTTCVNSQSVISSNNSTQLTLEPGHTYNISVQAVNTIGSSLVSNAVYSLAPVESPNGTPQSISFVAVNETSVDISWEGVPCSQKNGEIISYSVNYFQVGDDVELSPVSTMMSEQKLTLSGLRPLTRYSVSVAAVNENGTGPASPPITIATTTGSVVGLQCLGSNQSSIITSWLMPYPLPRDGLQFEVSHAEALDCGPQTVASSRLTVQVSNGLAVIDKLNPSSCYNLTVKPVASGFVEGESQSILCRTVPATSGEVTSLGVMNTLISLVVILGLCLIFCTVSGIGYFVCCNKRSLKTKSMPIRCQTEPININNMVLSELYSTNYKKEETPPPPLPPMNTTHEINVYDQIRVNSK